MEVGIRCVLDTSSSESIHAQPSPTFPSTAVFGVIIGRRHHLEDPTRALFYFHTVSIEIPTEYRRVWWKSSCSGGRSASFSSERIEKHFSNDLISRANYFVSSDGYKYQYDGWYDEEYLVPIPGCGEGERSEDFQKDGSSAQKSMMTTPIPQSWVEAMDQQPSLCEVRYLCYSFLPWFHSPYDRFSYLSLPERHCCYSLYICHRCLTPFFSEVHLAVHLEGYCEMARPPGEIIYLDQRNEQKVYYVDGARHLHYGRCVSLLGKFFIESQSLAHDVDLYEFFIATIPSRRLPYLGPEVPHQEVSMGESQSLGPTPPSLEFCLYASFKEAAVQFDKREKKWAGDVVVGYFSRLKHQSSHALSCIVVLPPFQRMGMGIFLLDVAYFLTRVRQTTCGCIQCGRDGGAIARPFSPHGQQLLLYYWGTALRRALRKKHKHALEGRTTQREEQKDRKHSPEECTSASLMVSLDHEERFVTFKSLHHLQEWIDIPIHMEDLEFLLVHDPCAFYNTREQGSRNVPSSGTSSPSIPFVVTLACEEKDLLSPLDDSSVAENERSTNGFETSPQGKVVFNDKWILRDATGSFFYRKECFHY